MGFGWIIPYIRIKYINLKQRMPVTVITPIRNISSLVNFLRSISSLYLCAGVSALHGCVTKQWKLFGKACSFKTLRQSDCLQFKSLADILAQCVEYLRAVSLYFALIAQLGQRGIDWYLCQQGGSCQLCHLLTLALTEDL